MRNILITLLLTLLYNVSSAQSGWGYVNYTSYKTHAGNGSTNQYGQFAYDATQFDNILNTANSNTTITHTGEVPLSYIYNGSTQTPHWGGDFYAIKFDFYFVPQVTGTYYFGINSDDASDLSIDGTIIATYYGGHGASGYQTGQMTMVAGQKYKVVVRYQEYAGGDALYFRWYRPGVGWGFWNNEVTNIGNEPTKKARINFDFGSTLDKTKFNIGSALSSTGWVDVTNSLDSVKVSIGNKAIVTPGQVEWSVMNLWNGINYIFIDARKLNGVQPTSVTQVKVLDLYEGPVTFYSYDGTWAVYSLPVLVPKLSDGTSAYNSLIRPFGIYYGLSCDISFTAVEQYKPQSVTMTTTNTLTTLYNSIVTVSDVYLAFKELANGGIFGNQTGNEFTYGIQYKNADVNDDGVFNEADCFALLQHLTGKKNLVDTFNLNKTLKLIPTSTYNTIGKSNWSTFSSYLGDTYNFDINTNKAIDTINISGTWKGDVNLSHSATPPSNGITTMSVRTMSIVSNDVNIIFDTEIVGDSIVATIKLDPLQQQVAGLQFNLNYDKSLINYSATQFKVNGNSTNFSKTLDEVISIGSINTSGQTFSNTTTYTVSFKQNTKIDNILGLISISNCEIINTNGNILKAKIL